MKAKYLYLESIPHIHWKEWNEVESLRSSNQVRQSEYFIVFSPKDCQFFVMFFDFEKCQWRASNFASAKMRDMHEISHFGELPEYPKNWGTELSEFMDRLSVWSLQECQRKLMAKEIAKRIDEENRNTPT